MNPSTKTHAVRAWTAAIGAAAATALVLGLWASVRGIDGDEGFYLTAGRHVLHGRRLYADVFYPQMPYLPWMEALMFRVFGVSLDVGRALSIAASAIGVGILVWLLWRVEGSLGAALIGAVLVVAHGPSLHFLPLAKTYGLTALFLLAAFAPFALGKVARWPWALGAGVAAGIAIGVRLPTAATAAVLAVFAWRAGITALLAFAAGGLLGSLGWLAAAVAAPEHFWFCNMTFHVLRREISGFGPIAAQKADVLAKWLLLPQNLIVWGLVALALWRGPRRWAAFCCGLALAVALAAATPTYLQYMAHFMPFFVLAAGPALARVARQRGLAALVVGAYLIALYPAIRVPAEGEVAAKRELWDRDTVFEVAGFVRAHTAPDDPVLSWWEGYPVLTDRPEIIGVGFWESNMARKVDPETAKRFHVVRQEVIRDLIERRVPGAIITTTDVWRQHEPQIDAGYDLARTVGSVEVYLRRGAKPD